MRETPSSRAACVMLRPTRFRVRQITSRSAVVRAVFKGDVTSVIVIPGAGKAVIVSHGAYRSVYSNLRDVNVTKGQKLETKQAIGTVMTGDDGSVAHLEVWKVTADGMVKLDPALWLFRN